MTCRRLALARAWLDLHRFGDQLGRAGHHDYLCGAKWAQRTARVAHAGRRGGPEGPRSHQAHPTSFRVIRTVQSCPTVLVSYRESQISRLLCGSGQFDTDSDG
jgi:hypothetical protein